MTKVLMGFVGDLVVNRERPEEAFREVRDALRAPSVLFANLECAYTDDPRPVPSAYSVLSMPARNLDVMAQVGFNVMSLANNHILDAGYDAMLDTRARLRAQGVRTCGVGIDLQDAREPAILETGGLKIAFLAYASIFPIGYEARWNRPGLAPMRAYNFWREPPFALNAPGMRPLLTTIADESDLANLSEDISRARKRADQVIVSFHWGDQTLPFHLTDHETRTARHCIDQGAAMVIGHHHHAIRGMEWYKGKPIVYGLGHFVFDFNGNPDDKKRLAEPDVHRYLQQISALAHAGADYVVPDYYRMTLLAWATTSAQGIEELGFLPCRIADDGVVKPLALQSTEAAQLLKHLEQCHKAQGLNTQVISEGARTIGGLPTFRVVAA